MKKKARLEVRLTSELKELVATTAKERKVSITKIIEELIYKLAKS